MWITLYQESNITKGSGSQPDEIQEFEGRVPESGRLEIINIVSASCSPPGQAPERLDFGRFVLQSWCSLVSFMLYFLIIGSTLGTLGPHF